MVVRLSKSIFSKECVLKTVYSFGLQCNIIIEEEDYNYVLNYEGDDLNLQEFNEHLQEQQLRETLNLQFGNLRNLIYERAFEDKRE